MGYDSEKDKTLEELRKELDEFFLKSVDHPGPRQRVRFYGGPQPELTPAQKEENRLALARTALLAAAENARRAQMTREERDAEDAEEDRLCEEEEAEFERILAQRDSEERGEKG
jgi:hypothetical protein